MKSILCLLATTLFLTTANADSPTPPWFSAIAPDVFFTNPTSAQTGIFIKKVARFIFNYSDGATSGTYGMGVKLPARAIILQTYYKTITSFTDSGSTTVAFKCEDNDNLYVTKDITGGTVNAFYPGPSLNTAATMGRAIAADCEIKAVVDGGTNHYLTAGKVIGFVEYIVGDE